MAPNETRPRGRCSERTRTLEMTSELGGQFKFAIQAQVRERQRAFIFLEITKLATESAAKMRRERLARKKRVDITSDARGDKQIRPPASGRLIGAPAAGPFALANFSFLFWPPLLQDLQRKCPVSVDAGRPSLCDFCSTVPELFARRRRLIDDGHYFAPAYYIGQFLASRFSSSPWPRPVGEVPLTQRLDGLECAGQLAPAFHVSRWAWPSVERRRWRRKKHGQDLHSKATLGRDVEC